MRVRNHVSACIFADTCDKCVNAHNDKWNCSWCEVANTDIRFCSDAEGKHRMNEQFQ